MPALPTASVAVVYGTRPEAIKLHGIVDLFGPAALVVSTGQHYDRSLGSAVLEDLDFPPADEVLAVGGTSRGHQIGAATIGLDEVFRRRQPSVVVVQGDTNATLAGALAASAMDLPVVHVEAGLRSFDRAMPEEHNRVLVDHLAELCCAPTEDSALNLQAESIGAPRVSVTGNTVVEATMRLLPEAAGREAQLAEMGLTSDRFVLATLHRPENTDRARTLTALLEALGRLPLPVVLPLHPRARARVAQFGLERLLEPLHVCAPLPPRAFAGLGAEAALWVSDSGGLQEEASVLKKPVLVPRRSTERPEVLGTFAELVSASNLVERAEAWLGDDDRRHALAAVPSPYGDGTASQAVVFEIATRFLCEDRR